MVVALLILVVSNNAFAWGHLKELKTPTAHQYLVFAALDWNEIRYCFEIDRSVRPLFDESSVSLQLESSFRAWLAPVRAQGLVGNVKFTRTACSDSRLNLRVEIGPERDYPALGAYHVERPGYSLIKLNTDFRRRNNSRILDFKSLMELGTSVQLVELLERLELSVGYSVQDFAEEARVDYVSMFWSTYRVLLHETGHAFGLCDTAKASVAQHCDPNFLTPVHEGSVMSDSNFLSLTQDDEAGILRLFRRFKR